MGAGMVPASATQASAQGGSTLYLPSVLHQPLPTEGIAFSHRGSISLIDTSGNPWAPITAGPQSQDLYLAVWSLTNQTIRFAHETNGTRSLMTIRSNGSDLQWLATIGPEYGSVVWSADGSALAFTTRYGNSLVADVGVMYLDGGPAQRLTTDLDVRSFVWGSGE